MGDSLVASLSEVPRSREQAYTEQFYQWERRGRGWDVHSYPVEIEPPLRPMYVFDPGSTDTYTDDARQPTFLSRIFQPAPRSAKPEARPAYQDFQERMAELDEPVVCGYYDEDFHELQIILPQDLRIGRQTVEQLLSSLSYCKYPISFEVIGNSDGIIIQVAAIDCDLEHLEQQLAAHFPNTFIRRSHGSFLEERWSSAYGDCLLVDFGLSREFLLPLAPIQNLELDPLVAIVGAMAKLDEGETAVFQVLFQRARADWAREMIDSLRFDDGSPFFADAPELISAVKQKVGSPIYAAVLRIAAKAGHPEKRAAIVRGVASGLAQLAHPLGNELIPLSNDGYPDSYHEQALLRRLSFRAGLILNLDELVSIVHPPSLSVRTERLIRDHGSTKPPPDIAKRGAYVLGHNTHQETISRAGLTEEQRTRHIHLCGSSGSGKSTLLLSLIKQDLDAGHGLCVVDPHGDLIESVMASTPESRAGDVIVFDPADEEFPVGFNILQARSGLEKTILSSDLVATFRRMATSWGDVMDAVLANAVLAFLESSRGGTLFELKRFLVERSFREEFLETVADQAVRYFWENDFQLIAGKPAASILIRLDSFLRQSLIRNIVCQKENRIDFRGIMDGRKILLVKLSQGLIGEENAYLLGTMLVSRIYQAALSRQETHDRPYFWLYLDEFHHFITPSMERILSGSRKYNLGLVLAHQEFRQLQTKSLDVASSVLSNCYTRICFRLGDNDAEKFASGFSFFDANSLKNLGVGEAIARIERSEFDFNLSVSPSSRVSRATAEGRTSLLIASSRDRYATRRRDVEEDFNRLRVASPKVQSTASETHHPREANTAAARRNRRVAAPESKTVHRDLQELIKSIAEQFDFIGVIEKAILGGTRRVDVALERDSLRIACEVADTNAIQYEVGNIQKCFAAGFHQVIVVSPDPRHLKHIREAAMSTLEQNEVSKISFVSPEDLDLLLGSIPKCHSDQPHARRVKGYKLETSYKESSDPEEKHKRNFIRDLISRVRGRQRT